MKKNVGIITWHYYENFGSSLQAYALQTMLGKLGFSCEFINYRKSEFTSSKNKIAVKYILSSITKILPLRIKGKYGYKFIQFQFRFLKQSKRITNVDALKKYASNYSVLICGSDQIWAPNVFDPVYFLSFSSEDIPKVAYAPSIGLNSIPELLHEDYSKLLRAFDCLSIREEKGAELINDLFDLKAEVVLDPTFLLDKREWEEIITKRITNSEYIFCYFLSNNDWYMDSVEKLANSMNCKIVIISNVLKHIEIADYVDRNAGPCEFLNYIKNAKLVITDSFHGVAFSIIFNKNFHVFERFSPSHEICQNSRIYNILSKLGLTGRIVGYKGTIQNMKEIEYIGVEILLKAEREKSINYLNNSISKFIN